MLIAACWAVLSGMTTGRIIAEWSHRVDHEAPPLSTQQRIINTLIGPVSSALAVISILHSGS